jgi:hypothetical protein
MRRAAARECAENRNATGCDAVATWASVRDICAVAYEGKGAAAAAELPGRRSASRYPLNADVEILEPFNAHGVVINASEGGLRVAVDVELPLDTVCVVEVQLVDGKTVEMARVAWVRAHPDGFLVGLSFVAEE